MKKITKILKYAKHLREIPLPMNKDMQSEFNFILAEQMTKMLLIEGLISVEELNKIMEKNRGTFSTLLSRIIP